MNRFFRWLAWAVALGVGGVTAAQTGIPGADASSWPVSAAPARFTVTPLHMDTEAILSEVKIFLPDPNWANLPIRVFSDTGVGVGSDVLWSAPGEPLTLLFDSSGHAAAYQVYLGSNWPPMHLPDPHAGVWLETRAGDGRTITALQEMLDSWAKSTNVLGRAITPGLYEGGNRFGPQTNLFLHMQGWFAADKPEHLDFTTVSVDSSFVLVDGKEVVEWPGMHSYDYPQKQGPPQGGVDVDAGIHSVDYYNAYIQRDGGRPPVLACLGVKGGPYPEWKMLAQDERFFRPVTSNRVTTYELRTDNGTPVERVPPIALEWENVDESPIYTDYSDLGLVGIKFTGLTQVMGSLTWSFDDGTTAEGTVVTHVFPRPGLRTVQVSVKDGDTVLGTVKLQVAVHFKWAPPYRADPLLQPEHETAIMALDPATLSGPDIASVFAVFGAFHQTADLVKFGPQVCAKMKDAKDGDLPFLKDAILHLTHDDRTDFALEEQMLRALIDRASASSAPASVEVASESRLVLAELLVKMSDHLDEARKLIGAINEPSLTDTAPRALSILRADLALAAGDVDGARKQYQTLTPEPQGADARSSIRRTAKIAQSRAYAATQDFDSAEDALREVSWKSPVEKLTPDWALARLHLYEAENLPDAAYQWAKRMMPVITTAGRSELLYEMTDLAMAQKDSALAHTALTELLKKHPYSAEAARAKEKWPVQN